MMKSKCNDLSRAWLRAMRLYLGRKCDFKTHTEGR